MEQLLLSDTKTLSIILATILSFAPSEILAVVFISKIRGKWETNSTWSCWKVRTITDSVVLVSPFTVTLNNTIQF